MQVANCSHAENGGQSDVATGGLWQYLVSQASFCEKAISRRMIRPLKRQTGSAKFDSKTDGKEVYRIYEGK